MRFKHKPKFQFDWHDGCQFELLIDGPEFFPRMLTAINQATDFILLEIYLIESSNIATKFIDALIAAKQRGAKVSLILDDYGARGLSIADRHRLTAQHIEVVFFNPLNYRQFHHSLRRDHRKLLIVDGHTAFVGGAGITDDFALPQGPQQSWHDVMVQIRGPVISDWIQVFMSTWEKTQQNELTIHPFTPAVYEPGSLGRVVLSEGPLAHEINRSLIKRIRVAERLVWIVTPYFVASWKIRRQIKHAARRGVDVRLLLPGPISDHPWVSHASRAFYTRLLKNGVRIFEFQPRFAHAKIELCDSWVSIGSSNLDRWNQRWNMDANQEIDDSLFSATVQKMFKNDFLLSNEITLQAWLNRSWLQRAREWFWGRIVLLLDRIGRSYKR